MTRLVALTAIAHSIGVIEAGQAFLCHDPELARTYVSGGQARLEARPTVNARGWGGLLWGGATVVCIASGPGLTAEQCERVRAWRFEPGHDQMRRVVVVNTSFRQANWADVLYACDARWWRKYFDEASAAVRGELWTQSEDANFKNDRLRVIQSKRGGGLNRHPGIINQAENSGFQAIGLAYQAGAARIILLGFDMHSRGGSHWHGDHPQGLKSALPFRKWITAFDQLAKDATGVIDIINCSPSSALKCFRELPLEEALA